jgi:secreted PhoX family phosphatase
MSDRVFGENTDGMELFNIDGREMIVVNSEYTNRPVNLPHAAEGVPTGLDDVRILQHLQGVNGHGDRRRRRWLEVVVDSPYNRRIHHNTPMTFDGPAAGHDLLKTEADPTGMNSLGTMNNCGSGRTPWGTYLTCEENFNGYFGRPRQARIKKPLDVSVGFQRYGIGTDGWGYDYHKWDARFDVFRTPTSRTARATSWRSTRRPRCDPGQAHGARPFQARERGLRDRR